MKSLSTFVNEELIKVTKKYDINISVDTLENSGMFCGGYPYSIDGVGYNTRSEFISALQSAKELQMEGVKEVEINFLIRIDDPILQKASTQQNNIYRLTVLNVYHGNGRLKRTEVYIRDFGDTVDSEVKAKIVKSVKQQYESITGLKTKYTDKEWQTYKRDW